MLSPSICRPGQLVGVLSWRERQVIVSATYVLNLYSDMTRPNRTEAVLACGLNVPTKCLVPVDPSVN